MGNELEAGHILPLLRTNWLGHSFRFFSEIGSTNVALKKDNAKRPLPNGTLYLTDFQTAGRGRLNRSWVAPKESSLLLSILLRPNLPPENVHWLTMMGSLAAVETVHDQLGIEMRVKWPNDLVVQQKDVWHKVGGILVEGEFDGAGQLTTAVYGMGLNLNIPANQLPDATTPATSLMMVLQRPVEREQLLLTFLDQFEQLYEDMLGGYSPVADWRDKLVTIGQTVTVSRVSDAEPLLGTAVDITPSGYLIVKDEQGHHHTLQAGDVSLRGCFDN